MIILLISNYKLKPITMTTEEFKKLSKEEQAKVPFKEWPKGRRVGCLVSLSIILLIIVGIILIIKHSASIKKKAINETYLPNKTI